MTYELSNEVKMGPLSIKELEERIKTCPIDLLKLRKLLDKRKIKLQTFLPVKGSGLVISRRGTPTDYTTDYNILIDARLTVDEKMLTLAHELVHIFYEVNDNSPNYNHTNEERNEHSKQIEAIIEREGIALVKQIYHQLKNLLLFSLDATPQEKISKTTRLESKYLFCWKNG